MTSFKKQISNKNLFLSAIVQQSKPIDKEVKQWFTGDYFDTDKNHYLFTQFIETTFGIKFNHTLFNWELTIDDIMQMESKKIKIINKFILSYNRFISLKVELKMPKISQQCIDMYKSMNEQIKILTEKVEKEKSMHREEIKRLKQILKKHNIVE
ncbi:hypothetical protein [Spiroplasma culicicola]|uniref:Uncharacterized protein n=1 Tax=Spiroplasma culicicola AES-1 TaxID=1276246 RepID=W6A5Y6_9MOLU|nr:hypothetical protein [Spiroplasma culicicola]AHI52407.1 hypothetical protein SCULI_v1c00660 [Spiroplasma culicicola AES-1]